MHTMNAALTQLAADCGLASDTCTPLRLAFGLACVQRVRHLLDDPEAIAGLNVLVAFTAGTVDAAMLAKAAVHALQRLLDDAATQRSARPLVASQPCA
jgi:hypothetical protein